jgi:hypothetical protein
MYFEEDFSRSSGVVKSFCVGSVCGQTSKESEGNWMKMDINEVDNLRE